MIDKNDNRGIGSSERQFEYAKSKMGEDTKVGSFDARGLVLKGSGLADGTNQSANTMKDKMASFVNSDKSKLNKNSDFAIYEKNADKKLYADTHGNNNVFVMKLEGYAYFSKGNYKFTADSKVDDFFELKINKSMLNAPGVYKVRKYINEDGEETGRSLAQSIRDDLGSMETVVKKAFSGSLEGKGFTIEKDGIYPIEMILADTRGNAKMKLYYSKDGGVQDYFNAGNATSDGHNRDMIFISKKAFDGIDFANSNIKIDVSKLAENNSLVTVQDGDSIKITDNNQKLSKDQVVIVDGKTYKVDSKGNVVVEIEEKIDADGTILIESGRKGSPHDISYTKVIDAGKASEKTITFEVEDLNYNETKVMDISHIHNSINDRDIFNDIDIDKINSGDLKEKSIVGGEGQDTVILKGQGEISFDKLSKVISDVEKIELGGSEENITLKNVNVPAIDDILHSGSGARGSANMYIQGDEGDKVELSSKFKQKEPNELKEEDSKNAGATKDYFDHFVAVDNGNKNIDIDKDINVLS